MIQHAKHGSYQEKLFDPKWQSKRKVILTRDKFKCVICGSDKGLNVHHKQYHFSMKLNRFRDPWEYDHKYLITLCESCHKRGHAKFNVPTKNI
jgi:5-methylcytosine-specific restriction endonuclease McrA